MIQPDTNGLYHPATEDEIIDLINYAVHNKRQVRVRGAAQSLAAAVYTDGFTSKPDTENINIELDQLRAVSINADTMQVTVGGGCNLGFDPFDPSNVSEQNNANNLLYQLDQFRSPQTPNGLAIQNVPDAIHQTVAGFISTGSSGGSMQHSFDDCILAIRIIDGTGKVNIFTKSSNLDDPFYGVVVSMGLMGIITQVTLQCVPAFDIIGSQTTSNISDCEFDFLGSGSANLPSMQQFLTVTEFTRTMWWPIKTLERAVVYKARTMLPADYTQQTGIPPNFVPKPFTSIFPKLLGSTLPAEEVAATGFTLIATWPTWLTNLLGDKKADFLTPIIDMLAPKFYPMLINMYFACNSPSDPPQTFWDNWLGSLPMDKAEFSNNLFDLAYTEMWFPISETSAVLTAMQNYYVEKGYSATGFFTTEIFAAKSSDFWLSPAYGQNVVRVNMLLFNAGTGNPTAYFQQFWDLLESFNFRPHWGKLSPVMGSAYMQTKYPKFNEWTALRDQMDPEQIFVNDHWRAKLGIPALN